MVASKGVSKEEEEGEGEGGTVTTHNMLHAHTYPAVKLPCCCALLDDV